MSSKTGGLKEAIGELIKKPLERLWHIITREKIQELKVEAIRTTFLKSLEIKEFMIRRGKVEISLEELEEEPRKAASQLESLLKDIK